MAKMDFTKHIKPLQNEIDYPVWKRKMRDLLDYHEGALDVIEGRLVKPESLPPNATADASKLFKEKADLYRKANSYAKSMITSAVSDDVYMHLSQFDVSTAFLYGELEENIYMNQPEGFDDGTKRVCQLKRSLYGLKQAPRCWNQRFGNYLLKLGFKSCEADPCLYMRTKGDKKLMLVLYVDDGLVAATDPKELELFLSELREEFKITTKDANYFLGLEIKRNSNGIFINQEAYAKRILERFNFSNCRPVSSPMIKGEYLEPGKENNGSKFPYRQVVGAIMYLILGTRPNLAYSIVFFVKVARKSYFQNFL